MRHGDSNTSDILGILAVVVLGGLLIGYATGTFSTTKGPSSNSNSLPMKFAMGVYSQDADALSTPLVNVFSPANSWNVIGSDNPGAATFPFTTSSSYTLQAGNVGEFTATGAYPIWAPLNGASFSMGGQTVLTESDGPCSTTSTTNCHIFGATPIQAPGSGASATTYVIATAASTDTNSLATADGGNLSSTPVQWNVGLALEDAYAGAGYQECPIATTAGPLMNYQSNSPVPVGTSQCFQTVLIATINDTTTTLNPAVGSGLTMSPVTNPGQGASTSTDIFYGWANGCTPAGSTDTFQTCLTASIMVSDSSNVETGHASIQFIWMEMQQPAYITAHFAGPGVTDDDYAQIGAAAGILDLFNGGSTSTGITPTGGPDAGAPTVLVIQTVGVVQYLADPT